MKWIFLIYEIIWNSEIFDTAAMPENGERDEGK